MDGTLQCGQQQIDDNLSDAAVISDAIDRCRRLQRSVRARSRVIDDIWEVVHGLQRRCIVWEGTRPRSPCVRPTSAYFLLSRSTDSRPPSHTDATENESNVTAAERLGARACACSPSVDRSLELMYEPVSAPGRRRTCALGLSCGIC